MLVLTALVALSAAQNAAIVELQFSPDADIARRFVQFAGCFLAGLALATLLRRAQRYR